MKAISLWQPYASAMAEGLKRNETRNRLTHVRGELAICSTQKKTIIPSEQAINFARHFTGETMTARAAWNYLFNLKRGFVLCVVEVFDCQPTTNFVMADKALLPLIAMTEIEKAFGDYSPGRFAWRTRNLRRLKEPVPVKGGQGFFNLTGETLERVKAQL